MSLLRVVRCFTPSIKLLNKPRNVTFDAVQREALFETQTRWLWNEKERESTAVFTRLEDLTDIILLRRKKYTMSGI